MIKTALLLILASSLSDTASSSPDTVTNCWPLINQLVYCLEDHPAFNDPYYQTDRCVDEIESLALSIGVNVADCQDFQTYYCHALDFQNAQQDCDPKGTCHLEYQNVYQCIGHDLSPNATCQIEPCHPQPRNCRPEEHSLLECLQNNLPRIDSLNQMGLCTNAMQAISETAAANADSDSCAAYESDYCLLMKVCDVESECNPQNVCHQEYEKYYQCVGQAWSPNQQCQIGTCSA